MRCLVRGLPLLLIAFVLLFVPLRAAAAQDGASEPPLSRHVDSLGSFDYSVRTQAARLLRRAAAAEAVPVLSAAARAHADEFVRFRSLVLLTGFNDRGTPALMHALIGDRNDRVREVAYSWFEQHPDPEITASLLAALQDETAEFVRPALVSALAVLGDDPRVQRALLFEIGRGMDFFRSAVIEILGRHRAAYAVEMIAEVAHQQGPLQYEAVLALGRIRDRRAMRVLDALTDAPADVQVARSVAGCLIAERCDTHLADVMRAASEPGVSRPVLRAAVTALVTLALDADDLRATSLLYELATAGESTRGEAARGIGLLAIRGPDHLLAWLDRISGDARAAAFDLIEDGIGRFEDDFRKEQLFTALRAAYWQAAEGSTMRELTATLIETLEF